MAKKKILDYEEMWDELKEWLTQFPDNHKHHPEYQQAAWDTINKMDNMDGK